MRFALRTRLVIMMFLQYYVWGIWLPMLYQRIGPNGLNFDAYRISWIFMVYGLGAIIGPFIVGQLADRYFATEKVLAFAHFFGGVLLIATAYAQDFWTVFILLFIYCNLYMPSMGLSNSITFRSLGEAKQSEFAFIRTAGTIGWIAAGWSYAAYLNSRDVPAMQSFFANKWIGPPSNMDCLRIAGVVSLVYGLYCFLLPHTPPVPPDTSDPKVKRSAVLESLELMRNRSFAVLIVVAGLIGIMLAFYFQLENPFLEYIGKQPDRYLTHDTTLMKWGSNVDNIGAFMTIGQVAEVLVMFLVPVTVAKLGVKKTMILGAGAWALRFGLSTIGYPWELMIITIGLHGFCFGFFFVVAQMYVDRAASGDIKASAQNLFVFVAYGLGTIFGNLFAGMVSAQFGSDWRMIWAGPFVLTILCILAFMALFREEEIRKTTATSGEELA